MNSVLKGMASLLLIAVFAVSCTKPDEPNNGGNNGQNDSIVDDSLIFDDHDYVDLGLPSGLLWATCNVGATNPEDFGDFLLGARPNQRTFMTGKATNMAIAPLIVLR